jgi:hypothetical protein
MVQITEHQRVQSNLKLTQKVANRFAEAEKRLFDDQVVNQIYMVQASDIPAASKTAVAITEANVFAQIEVLRVALKKNNVDDNIALFVSPQIESWLLQSKLLDNSDT